MHQTWLDRYWFNWRWRPDKILIRLRRRIWYGSTNNKPRLGKERTE